MLKKRLSRLICFLLLLCFIISAIPCYNTDAASKPPSFNAALTDDNMMKLLKAYDSDAYYFVSRTRKKGSTFGTWMAGSENLAEAATVTVHEEFHKYTHTFYKFDWDTGFSDKYYLGKKKNIYVSETNLFKTETVTKNLPKQYRTFRYDTYVSKGSSVSANQNGVYGLLNEFSAYYWGMHVDYALYPYYDANVKSGAGWHHFENSYINNRDAYAEFYYWTLVYLEFARVKKPKVYKDIMNNKNYIITFDKMQKAYVSLMKKYEKKLDIVNNKYYGHNFNKNQSYGGYRVLMSQINSKKYKKVREAIKTKAKKYKKQ